MGGVPAAPATTAASGSAESGTKKPKPTKRPRSRPPKQDGGGDGKKGAEAPKGNKTDLKEFPCYFHSAAQHGAGKGCSKGANCPFSHSKVMSKADFEAAERPRSVSASNRTGKGGGKGRPSAQARTPSAGKRTVPYHCNKFLKDGTCPSGDTCKYPHLTKGRVRGRAREDEGSGCKRGWQIVTRTKGKL